MLGCPLLVLLPLLAPSVATLEEEDWGSFVIGSSCVLEAYLAQGGYTEDLGVMKKKLSIEFESLTSAHLAYVDQLEQEGASAFEHTSHNDCQHWENYFVEIINKVTDAHYKINRTKDKSETNFGRST